MIAIGFPVFYIILASVTATLGFLNYFESVPIGLFEMCSSLLIALLACLRPGRLRVVLQLLAILFYLLVSLCVFILWGQERTDRSVTKDKPTLSMAHASDDGGIPDVEEKYKENIGMLNAQGVSLFLLVAACIVDNFCKCKVDYERY